MKEKVNMTGVPETMNIRKQFLIETGSIYQIAKSAMDDSYVDDIDYHGETWLILRKQYYVSVTFRSSFSRRITGACHKTIYVRICKIGKAF